MSWLLLVALLILPFTLFFIGLMMFLFPPKKINNFVGYRTPNSMHDVESWNYAQRTSGKSFMIVGLIDIIIDLAIGLPLYIVHNSHFTMVAIALIFFNILPIIPSVIITDQKIYYNRHK